MLLELAVKGSGAATLESFYDVYEAKDNKEQKIQRLADSHFLQTIS